MIVELAATIRPPAEMTSESEAVMLLTDSTFVLIVTVRLPDSVDLRVVARSGTMPVLQLLATSQDPLVAEIHESVARSWRDSRISITGSLRFRRLENSCRVETEWNGFWTWCCLLMMIQCACQDASALPTEPFGIDTRQ